MGNPQRELNFGNLDEVADDVRHLTENGYTPGGNWNLSQVCGHLNDWMQFPMDGFPVAPLPVRFLLWMMKTTTGRKQLRSILADGFRPKIPTMPKTVHAVDEQTDAVAAEQFLETIERFKVYDGPIASSPVFGDLTPDEALQLQLRHCSHHLSYLQPRG